MKQKEVSNLKQNTFTGYLEIKKVKPFIFFKSKGKPYGI